MMMASKAMRSSMLISSRPLLARPFAPAGAPTGRGQVSGMRAVAVDAPAAAAAAATGGSSSDHSSGSKAQPSFKAHLDFKFVKENLQLVIDNCKERFANSANPAKVVELYDEFTRLKQESDTLRASRNENSAAMKVGRGAPNGALFRHG